MKVILKNEEYELEQFNGDFGTKILTKTNGFNFTPNAPGICSCGRGFHEHILNDDFILCPEDFVLKDKKGKVTVLKRDFFLKKL